MKKLYLVSFPRSGQLYTQQLMEAVTGVDDYCELYNCWVEDCPGKSLPISEKSPCLAGRRIQKTHDFDLKFPVDKSAQYAVIVRTPMLSLASWFELEVKNLEVQDTLKSWESFADLKSTFWNDFVNKWVDAAETNENVQVFRYEDITTSRAGISKFFKVNFPGSSPEKVKSCAKEQVREIKRGRVGGRSLSDFKYPIDSAVNTARYNISKTTLARVGYTDVVPVERRRWWPFLAQ